jgi:hypothetical protein
VYSIAEFHISKRQQKKRYRDHDKNQVLHTTLLKYGLPSGRGYSADQQTLTKFPALWFKLFFGHLVRISLARNQARHLHH